MKDCAHRNYTVTGEMKNGHGLCTDCGQMIHIAILVTNQLRRIENKIDNLTPPRSRL